MKAVVVGCGVGGPAVALYLRRIGWQVQILEAAAGPDPSRRRLSQRRDQRAGRAHRARTGRSPAERRASLPADGHVERSGPATGRGAQRTDGGARTRQRRGPASVVAGGAARRRDRSRRGHRVRGRDWRRCGRSPTASSLRRRTDAASAPTSRSAPTASARWCDATSIPAPDRPEWHAPGLLRLGRPRWVRPRDRTGADAGQQHFVFGRRSFFGYLVRDDGTVFWFANLTRPEPDRGGSTSGAGQVWLEELADLARERRSTGAADRGGGRRHRRCLSRSTTLDRSTTGTAGGPYCSVTRSTPPRRAPGRGPP